MYRFYLYYLLESHALRISKMQLKLIFLSSFLIPKTTKTK